MDTLSSFDIGPLTWVKGEIDLALDSGSAALKSWNGTDTLPLREAGTYLHQVAGALQIVDLQGVYQVCSAVETLLADMQTKPELRNPDSARVALDAIAALRGYLDALMDGVNNNELRLNAPYAAVLAQRGAEAPAPTDLFRPDIGARVRRTTQETALDDMARARAVHGVRGRYQRGLLRFLMNREAGAGLAAMGDAVAEMEQLAPGAAQYTFWWAVGGMIDALKAGRLSADFWVKRTLGRIDMQLRRLSEGANQLADRLFRDVLFFLALDPETTGRAAEARDLFELDPYLVTPQSEEEARAAEALRPHLSALRDAVNSAKDLWMSLCAGREDSLSPLRAAAGQARAAADALPSAGLPALVAAVQEIVGHIEGSDEAVSNEALQLEMASAMLLIQHGANDYFNLGRDFPELAELQAGRLRAVAAGEMPAEAAEGVSLLDEIARQAQEKLLVAQVSREIQTNLHQVEEILDKFFRNRGERAGLPMVPGLLKQIQGALNMLQLDVAAQLVQASLDRVEHVTELEAEVEPEDLNWIAEALSTLGMYVDDLRNGRADTSGLRALLAPPEAEEAEEESIEEQLEEDAARLRETSEQLAAAPDQTGMRDEMRRELTRISADADLVGNNDLRGQADAAIRLIEENAPAEIIQEAVRSLSGGAPEPLAPTPVPVAEVSEQEVDAELLEVYIEEAKEVLARVTGLLTTLRDAGREHEAFVDIRRGFHTLKGSGRMVGLTDLAEVAWEVEQTLNLWLRDERPITRAVLDFVEQAAEGFRGWVAELEDHGSARVEADGIVALARSLRGEAAPAEAAPVAAAVEAEEVEKSVEAETLPVLAEAVQAEPELEIEAPPAEAEALVEAAAETETVEAAPETVPGGITEPDTVLVGEHAVSAPLFAIFTEESANRLAELRQHLNDMMVLVDGSHWDEFSRAAHTLAGIARTTGLGPLADSAHAIEMWAQSWPESGRPLPPAAAEVLTAAVDGVAGQLEQIGQHERPEPLADLAERLAALQPAAPAAEAPPEEAAVALPPAEEAVVEADLAESCDPELLPIFLAEADELLPRIGETLRQWRVQPDNDRLCQELQRALHTLKGSARMAGAMILGDNTHDLETRVAELGEAAPDAAFLDMLEHRYDQLAEQVDRLRHPSPARPEAFPGPAPEAEPATAPAPAAPTAAPRIASVEESEVDVRLAFKAKSSALDNLISEAGEISVSRARIESALSHYKLTAQELTANVDRLRSQLRELEIQAETQIGARFSKLDEGHFDPLEFDRFTRLQELTRLMAESVNDVSTAQENMLADLSEVEYALLQQSRTARNLQQELMHIRMVRINSQSERLHRIVRQAAKDTRRQARLYIDGGDIELDRTVLDKAMAPFEHLLRNAVAHGIESSEDRHTAGKPEEGRIDLVARQEGTEVVLTLTDDGAGIRLDKVRARAEALGWIKSDDTVERERLESFMFMPGFSTMDSVTKVAGRGVGLDVVRSDIASVGGRVRVDSEPGKWTRFSIRLPATLALSQVILVSAGDQTYAIPAGMVVLVRELHDDQWQQALADEMQELDGQNYPLHSLAELTDQEPAPSEGRTHTVILLRSGDERVALRVDKLRGNTEAVVKAIGPQLARVPGVAGATVLADGRVSLILNPFALVEQAPAAAMKVAEESQIEYRPALVMVVDDSLTVRKITGRLLHREGYRVVTAKDGAEALELLQDELPAVMLLDIEMPRMDGFEVARHVRADRQTRDLPIIMITSRTADKHREHALALGVNAYMGKPYQEEELLSAIAGFVKSSS